MTDLYSVVIRYNERMRKSDRRYVIYSKSSKVVFETDSKYELLIYIDMVGYTFGKVMDERYRMNNFNKYWCPSFPKIVGKAYRLRKKKRRV